MQCQVLIALLYGTMYWNKGKVPAQSALSPLHMFEVVGSDAGEDMRNTVLSHGWLRQIPDH